MSDRAARTRTARDPFPGSGHRPAPTDRSALDAPLGRALSAQGRRAAAPGLARAGNRALQRALSGPPPAQLKKGSIAFSDDGSEIEAKYGGDGDLTAAKDFVLGTLTYEVSDKATYKDDRDPGGKVLEIWHVGSNAQTVPGIGSALIYGSALAAEREGAANMYVISSIVNEFYEKMGFTESTYMNINLFGGTATVKTTSKAKAEEKGWTLP